MSITIKPCALLLGLLLVPAMAEERTHTAAEAEALAKQGEIIQAPTRPAKLPDLTKLTPEAAKALAVFKGSGLSIDHLNAIATSSQAARGTKGDLSKAGPSRMPKRPAQVAADPPVAAQQSGTPAWQWLLGSAFLLTALVVYLAGRRPPCRNNTPTRPPHKIA